MTLFYKNFWLDNAAQETAIARSLKELAEGYDKTVTPGMYRLYTTVLAVSTRDQIVLAFSRAALECKLWPAPATLREFSGHVVECARALEVMK